MSGNTLEQGAGRAEVSRALRGGRGKTYRRRPRPFLRLAFAIAFVEPASALGILVCDVGEVNEELENVEGQSPRWPMLI